MKSVTTINILIYVQIFPLILLIFPLILLIFPLILLIFPLILLIFPLIVLIFPLIVLIFPYLKMTIIEHGRCRPTDDKYFEIDGRKQ